MVAHYGTAANLQTRNGTLFLHTLATCYSWTHPADCKGVGSHFLPDTFLRLCSPVPSLALQMFRLGLQAEKWDLGSLGAFFTGLCDEGSACLTAPVGLSLQSENEAVQAVMLLCVRFTPALWAVKKDCSLSRTLQHSGSIQACIWEDS